MHIFLISPQKTFSHSYKRGFNHLMSCMARKLFNSRTFYHQGQGGSRLEIWHQILFNMLAQFFGIDLAHSRMVYIIYPITKKQFPERCACETNIFKRGKGNEFCQIYFDLFQVLVDMTNKKCNFILFVKTPCVHPIVFCDIYFDFEGLVTSVTTKQNVWS